MALKSIINRPLELSLHLFGIWPSSSCPILKEVIWTTMTLICLVFQYWYCVAHVKSSDLIDILDGLSLTFSNTLVFLKLTVIWFNKRTFCDILEIMFEDWSRNYASNGENRQIMINTAILSSRIALAPFGEDEDELTTETRKLFVKMEFPFDATVSPLYTIILIVQFSFQAVLVLAAVMSIALIATLILHIGSQIEIFCKRVTRDSGYPGKEESQNVIIKDVICEHQRIIRLSENIEKMFRYISLGQFLSNIVVIGFISFVLASSKMDQGPIIIAKCFPYYIAVNCEAFILCYTGEYLSSKGENITEVIYNILWYEFKPRESRIILLTILRSQKQLKLTAGKFVTLSLEAFANMLKASASYVSVMLAVY
ncbi:odorant receptor 13a-like [Colletes latitarsis]|uniref:odorant receptor 13a-like n=1 Tax=Colletes latitarsis TaxID=2605962 RepID=UPI004035427E